MYILKQVTKMAAVCSLAMVGTSQAGVLYDSNGFENFTSSSGGADLVGQDGWVAFEGRTSIRVSTDRPINGADALRSPAAFTSATATAAAQQITVTPDVSAQTLVTVSGTIGNATLDDTGVGSVGLTTSTGSFDFVRLVRNGGSEAFVGRSAAGGGSESVIGNVAAADEVDATTAYEFELTLAYNPGADNDGARMRFREIGDTAWIEILSSADASGFVDLGVDATNDLFVVVLADNNNRDRSVRIDDLVVTSEVIPEPGSAVLASMAGAMFLARSRKHRHK